MQATRRDRRQLSTRDYARLAAWRRTLREFLSFSENAAGEVGLTGQHYQAMLVVRAWPEGEAITINDLAQELLIKHNSAVGLVDRLVKEELVERVSSRIDRRKVHLQLTARGNRCLAQLAGVHRKELQRIGPMLEKLLEEIAAEAAPEARP